MLQNRKSTSIFVVVLIAFLMNACGKDSGTMKKTDHEMSPGTTESVAADDQMAADTMGAFIADGLESLVEQDASGSAGLNLTGDTEITNNSAFTKTCTEEGNNAVVSIASSMELSIHRLRGQVEIERSLSGKSSQTRTWSRMESGSPVAVKCHTNGKSAEIDWSAADLNGLQLDLSFKRERTASSTFSVTSRRSGEKKSREFSHSFSAEGTRSILWGSVDSSDPESLIREKSITSSVKRLFEVERKNGNKASLRFNVGTKEDAPLKVKVVRAADSLKLKSKLIKEGTLVGERVKAAEGDASVPAERVETSFSNVLIEIENGTGQAVSGQIVTKIYAEGSTEPSRTLTIDFGQDDSIVTDSSSSEEITIDPPAVDAEDIVE